MLLFDEADALFGKRSEVKDSHDRYANIEVAYLLQRIEAYRGLAILTTNLKSALDRAFLRRIRFVVQFPFPDAAARERSGAGSSRRTRRWARSISRARALQPGRRQHPQHRPQRRFQGGRRRHPHRPAAAGAAAREEFAKLERSMGSGRWGQGMKPAAWRPHPRLVVDAEHRARRAGLADDIGGAAAELRRRPLTSVGRRSSIGAPVAARDRAGCRAVGRRA